MTNIIESCNITKQMQQSNFMRWWEFGCCQTQGIARKGVFCLCLLSNFIGRRKYKTAQHTYNNQPWCFVMLWSFDDLKHNIKYAMKNLNPLFSQWQKLNTLNCRKCILFHTSQNLQSLFIFIIVSKVSSLHPPSSPPRLIFHYVVVDLVNTKIEVPHHDLKCLIWFRHPLEVIRCLRSCYGISFVKSTAFNFGGGWSHHVVLILWYR
jgi:hypothetical protein